MKTAIWLYLFMFVAFFDLHAQYPMLSPFALSLGAAPSFIGLIMGVYSITHLPGNLMAGYGVDRYGSKPFIVSSLIVAGIVLVFQSRVTDPWHLLIIRSISGFVLAFLSPACLSLLAKLAKDRIQQGKLMAGNGFVHTTASVVSPAAGAILVAKLGFTASFTVLGWLLIATGLLALLGVRESPVNAATSAGSTLRPHSHHAHATPYDDNGDASSHSHHRIPWLFFAIPMGISCSQGILFFELPLMNIARGSIMTSGILFSLVSIGALCTLSLLFLHRYSAFWRTLLGSLFLALIFFGMAVGWSIPLWVSLVMVGMTKGVIFPAISTLLAATSNKARYGRVFSVLSISFSIGAFFGPMIAGQLRDMISPFFIAFVVLMLGLALLPFDRFRILAAA